MDNGPMLGFKKEPRTHKHHVSAVVKVHVTHTHISPYFTGQILNNNKQ